MGPEGSRMGSTKDKIRGMANTGVGRLKQGLAKDTGDDGMDAEGKTQELKGGVQRAIGNAKDAVGSVMHRIGAAVKRSGR